MAHPLPRKPGPGDAEVSHQTGRLKVPRQTGGAGPGISMPHQLGMIVILAALPLHSTYSLLSLFGKKNDTEPTAGKFHEVFHPNMFIATLAFFLQNAIVCFIFPHAFGQCHQISTKPQCLVNMLPPFASRHIAREWSAYENGCRCTHTVEEHRARLHDTLRRVLVFDMRFDWFGIGNSLGRWLGLVRVGTAAGYATFLWMRDKSAAHPGAIRPHGFDLGSYFVAEGGDWRWTPRAERRVRKAHPEGSTVLEWHCAHVGDACRSMRILDEHGTCVFSTSAEADGTFLNWLATRPNNAWIVLRPRRQEALEASGTPAVAWLGGWRYRLYKDADAPWCRQDDGVGRRGMHWQTSCAAAATPADCTNGTRRFAGCMWQHQRCVDYNRPSPSLSCEAFALLRPRPHVWRALRPALARLERFESVGGLHMRTGHADWQYYNGHRPPNQQRKSFEQQFALVDTLLRDCSQTSSLEACFDWKYPHVGRAPTLKDASLCAGNRSTWTTTTPTQGALSAIIACAARLADASSIAGAWGLLVLGDAPALASLVDGILPHKVVGTQGDMGNTAAQVHRTDMIQERGWLHSIVDFYLIGLCGGVTSALFSSFVPAALTRSVVCCTERVHFGAMYNLSTTHRDRVFRRNEILDALSQPAAAANAGVTVRPTTPRASKKNKRRFMYPGDYFYELSAREFSLPLSN